MAGNFHSMEDTQQAHPPVRRAHHVNLMVDTIITNVASDDIRTLVRALLSTSPDYVTDQFCSLAKAHLSHMPIPPAPPAPELFTIPSSPSFPPLTNHILTGDLPGTTLTNGMPTTLTYGTGTTTHNIPTSTLTNTVAANAIAVSVSGSTPEEPKPTPVFGTLLARARARYGAGLCCSSILVLLPIVKVARTMQWTEGSAIEEALSIVDCDIAAALVHAKEEVRQEGEARSQAVNVLQELRRVLESVEEEVERWGGDNPFERSLDALNGIET